MLGNMAYTNSKEVFVRATSADRNLSNVDRLAVMAFSWTPFNFSAARHNRNRYQEG